MITKFFLKRYDFKVLAYKSLQVFILLFLLTILFLGLISYDEFDPSPFSVGDEKPNNLLGGFGANFSSRLFFIFQALFLRPLLIKPKLLALVFNEDNASCVLLCKILNELISFNLLNSGICSD